MRTSRITAAAPTPLATIAEWKLWLPLFLALVLAQSGREATKPREPGLALARLRDRAPKRATLGGGPSERSRRRLGPASRDAGRATDCAGVGASANGSRRLNLPGDQLPQITQALHDVSNVHVVEFVDDWRHAAGGAIRSSMMAAVRTSVMQTPGMCGETEEVRSDDGERAVGMMEC